SPATFTITGVTGDPNCTATESPIPAGYTSTGTCAALLSVGTCTITNTLNSATFTVNKDFVPNDAATVSVTLTCGDGTVTVNPTNASEAAPAVFTVTGISGSTTCTASEGTPPAGYTASGCTSAVTLAANGSASCTITNTLIVNPFSVLKDFVPNNAASVTVSLSCVSGTVTDIDTSASEADDANFDVSGPVGDPNCTATEIPIPAGYVSTGTCSALLSV
ncbi:MAG: hypothetical protein IIA27_17270, partial [Gemmatimonadetes bacterium]|nr:hypothetical protein [Gemmatimonadota bacterium]